MSPEEIISELEAMWLNDKTGHQLAMRLRKHLQDIRNDDLQALVSVLCEEELVIDKNRVLSVYGRDGIHVAIRAAKLEAQRAMARLLHNEKTEDHYDETRERHRMHS